MASGAGARGGGGGQQMGAVSGWSHRLVHRAALEDGPSTTVAPLAMPAVAVVGGGCLFAG